MIQPIAQRCHACGFTLVEVLVALVITAIGLLALAAMQLTTLRNNSGSYLRSQAAVAAADLVDRMRVNPNAANSGAYKHGTPNTPPAAGPNCEGSTCSPTGMAQYDLDRWWGSASKALPTMGASITCNPDPCIFSSIHTITVMWDDARTGATGTGCDPANVADRMCYSLSFDL